MSRIAIKLVAAADTWALRHRVLRPHLPVESARYPEDSTREAVHIAAFDGDLVVGVASLYREGEVGEVGEVGEAGDGSGGAWRLRGMATAPEIRGTGVGGAILEEAFAQVKSRGATKIWCNARTSVAGFYERYGFEIFGEEYDMPGIGPHYLMKTFF